MGYGHRYWVEPSNGTSLNFLYLLLQQADLPSACAQTGVPGLNRDRAYDIPALLPPLDEQRRIVDLIGALDDTIEAADPSKVRASYDALIEIWMASGGQPLGDALTLSDSRTRVSKTGTYRIIGLLRSGEGFIDRGVTRGSDIGYAQLYELEAEQLVYRKLTAWEGPISVTTDAEAGGWVSSEFPVFDVDESRLRPGLLRHVCRWPGLWSRIGNRLVGSVQRRKRLNPSQLVQIEVPMPSLEEQDQILGVLDAAWKVVQCREAATRDLRVLRSNLLTALLSGEHEIPSPMTS